MTPLGVVSKGQARPLSNTHQRTEAGLKAAPFPWPLWPYPVKKGRSSPPPPPPPRLQKRWVCCPPRQSPQQGRQWPHFIARETETPGFEVQLVTRPGIPPGAPGRPGTAQAGVPGRGGREERNREGISQPHPPTSSPTQHSSPPAWVRKQNKSGPRAAQGRRGPQERDKEAASGARARVESRTEAERPLGERAANSEARRQERRSGGQGCRRAAPAERSLAARPGVRPLPRPDVAQARPPPPSPASCPRPAAAPYGRRRAPA